MKKRYILFFLLIISLFLGKLMIKKNMNSFTINHFDHNTYAMILEENSLNTLEYESRKKNSTYFSYVCAE